MKKLYLLALLPLLLANTSCDVAEKEQSQKTKQLKEEANRQIGMPTIINFQERRMMKDLYEKRDSALATHSYIMNSIKGCLVYLGASIGYGMPYATQFTSSVDYINNRPQPEPNGLYMPSDAHGTWIMLLNPSTKKAEPQYVEPDVIVSTFRLVNQECGGN
jgi:hypothetical protein